MICFLLGWSAFQWAGWSNSYQTALNYSLHEPKFRLQAKNIAIERGLLEQNGKLPAKKRREVGALNSKDEIDKILASIIEEKIQVRGGYGKPKPTDVAIFQVLFCPYFLFIWARKKATWYYRRNVLKVGILKI